MVKLASKYHPITIVFLDDNRGFLDALDLEFGERLNMISFTNPQEALHFIEKRTSESVLNSMYPLVSNVDTDTASGFDVCDKFNLLYQKTRFDEIAILVVDYKMPATNGIEFCQKLTEKSVLTIMLTAEADKDTAIQAFNQGLIHKFILKTHPNVHAEIALAIDELTRRYFKELSPPMRDIVNNESYRQLVATLMSQMQLVEYYVIDTSGSILFLDNKANPTWLIIRHNKELNEQIDLLQGYDIPPPMMRSFINHEKILFLFSDEDYKKPLKEWFQHMFDAHKLDDNYVYSIINGHLTNAITWEKVVSYSTYWNEKSRILCN